MKKIILGTILSFFLYNLAISQVEENIKPKSNIFSPALFSGLKEIILPEFKLSDAEILDNTDSKNGSLPKIARNIPIDISPRNSGNWVKLPNGTGSVWRIKITSSGAEGLIPLFDTLYIPEGATMHVYMPGQEEVIGAFTHDNTPGPTAFCPGLVHGESCIIEYFEPASQQGKGIIHLDKIGHAYRWVDPLISDRSTETGSCEVNVVCSPEGDNWRDQIRSVARVLVNSNDGEGYCSGALINNVRQDCTPYFMSAQHCTGTTGVTALEYSEWVFYFNYQASTCSGTTGPLNQIVNGCTKVADSEDDGGQYGSDFLLLKLNHSPSANYNAYFSGWNTTSSASSSGVGIHHPNADIKKISTYTTPAVSTTWGGIAQNTHWQVTWATTTNGHGVTEPGSSGSPLYDPQGYIVGHLTGGNSCCTSGACGQGSGPDVPDEYGKIAYDWTSDGSADTLRVKPWLDPDNTGTTQLAGMNATCGAAVANDAGISSIQSPSGNVCAATDTPSVVLRNYGSNTLTSVTINYTFDGNTSQYSWTGSLGKGSTTAVTLPVITLTSGGHSFSAATSNPNGTTDGNTANDGSSITFYVPSAVGNLTLDLTTDDHGSQTTWNITDDSSQVVASGGPYPSVTGGAEYFTPICLHPGCYTFTIYDSHGNGMTSGENGNFTLTAESGTLVYATLSDPGFGNQEADGFCISTGVGIIEIDPLHISVIPNPSTGVFNINFDYSMDKSIRVFDALGRMVAEQKSSDKNVVIDLSSQSKGIYILQVETQQGKVVQKLVLQ